MFRCSTRLVARSAAAASVRTATVTRQSVRTVATSSRAAAASGVAAPAAMRAAWIAGGLGAVAATGAALFATNQAECSWWPFGGGAKEDKYTPIRKAIDKIIDDNSCGPLFVRLAWHGSGTYDAKSGTGGSNGARMRFPPEQTDGANNGLDIARGLLEPVKAAFPDISYADLYTLAGAQAIEHAGGPAVCWKAGRVDESDGAKGCPGRLPDATQGAQHIRDVFYRMGFNDQEIVALVGAHTLGECHKDRSGFVGPWTRDPNGFDNSFYTLLLSERWSIKRNQMPAQYEDATGDLMMLPSDIAMITDPAFRKWVEVYAKDGDLWFKDFAKAFAKLLDLGVKQQTCPVKH